jgi:hypothetical protein
MNSIHALHQFWASFGLPAYDENTVPDDAPLPRITYSVSQSYFDEPVLLTASIWYRSTSWAQITAMADQIGQRIGYGGRILRADDGDIWIKRGVPFAQRMSDENQSIRRMYLNIEAEYFTNK